MVHRADARVVGDCFDCFGIFRASHVLAMRIVLFVWTFDCGLIFGLSYNAAVELQCILGPALSRSMYMELASMWP